MTSSCVKHARSASIQLFEKIGRCRNSLDVGSWCRVVTRRKNKNTEKATVRPPTIAPGCHMLNHSPSHVSSPPSTARLRCFRASWTTLSMDQGFWYHQLYLFGAFWVLHVVLSVFRGAFGLLFQKFRRNLDACCCHGYPAPSLESLTLFALCLSYAGAIYRATGNLLDIHWWFRLQQRHRGRAWLLPHRPN